MKAQELKIVKKRIVRQEQNYYKSKFNFGQNQDGSFKTSTSGGKAHIYNSLMRKIDEERNQNFKLMLEQYQNGYSGKHFRKRRKRIKLFDKRVQSKTNILELPPIEKRLESIIS